MQTRELAAGLVGQLLQADRGARARPGPAPTMTTSYAMDSRSLIRPLSSRRAGTQFDSICPANSLTMASMAVRNSAVGGEVESIGIAEARSALAWWLEAGVDVAVQEEPRDWLKPAAAARRAGCRAGAGRRTSSEPSHETLAELQRLAGEQRAAAARVRRPRKRILPHGPENAAVMLLSDAPALEDAAAGQPIGGEAWELAKRMLAAIGISADEAYSASLSCFHAPGARMTDADREACAEIARKHIAWPSRSGCCCSATGPRRRCSASRCRRRAAMSTRSKACARSRPSTRAS